MNAAVGADERLVVMLEARISEFEKRMAKAERTGTNSYNRLRRGSQSATRAMEADMVRSSGRINQALASTSTRIGTFAKSFATGFAGGALGAASLGAINQTIKGIAQIGDEAKRAGVSVEALQEWKYVAQQNRIGTDQMVDGLKELNLRADEFVTGGGGAAAEAFQRLGFGAAELKAKLADPSALLLEIIGRMQKLDKAAQIRVADEIFGGSAGERFVDLVSQGEAGLRRTIDRAHEVGAVMDSQMIAKAAELDRRWQDLTTRVGAFFRSGVVGAADLVVQVANLHAELKNVDDLFRDPRQAEALLGKGIKGAIEATDGAVDEHRDTVSDLLLEYERLGAEAVALAPLLQRAANEAQRLGDEQSAQGLRDIAAAMVDLNGRLDAGTVEADDFEREMGDLIGRAEKAMAAVQSVDSPTFAGVIERLDGLKTKLGEVITEALNLRAALPGGGTDPSTLETTPGDGSSILPPWTPDAKAPTTRPVTGSTVFIENDPPGGDKPTRGGGARSVDEYAQTAAAIREETRALEAEAAALLAVAASGQGYGDAVEYARVRAQLLHAAMQEGRQITPELEAEIDALAAAYVTAGQSAEDAAERMRKVQEASDRGAEAIGDIFMSVLDGSKSAKQAVADLLREIARVQIMKGVMGLFGSGGALSGVGKVVGGLLGMSSGGYTGDGGTYEPKGVVHGGEYVFSKQAVQRIGVPALESMHRNAKGYASGRFVGAAAAPSPSRTGTDEPTRLDVHVTASFDEKGNAIIRDVALATTSDALMNYDRQMPNRVQQIQNDPRRR